MKIGAASVLIALVVSTTAATAGTLAGVTAKPFPTLPKDLAGIVTGPDGNVWFADWKDNSIGRLSGDGTVKLFPLPQANSSPDQMTAALDGNVWFTEMAGRVGRITMSGAITETNVGGLLDGARTIVAGSDGAVWFFDLQSSFPPTTPEKMKLGRVAANGTLTTFDLGTSDKFVTMATGPDGNLWLYDSTKNAILLFSLASHQVTATYAIPTPYGDDLGFVNSMLLGPDNNLWFTHNNSVDRIKPNGAITEYPVPTPNAQPTSLSVGNDGNLWFAEFSAKKLGQLIVSTATDSGQATINESDVILGSGSMRLAPLRRASMNGSSSLRIANGVRAQAVIPPECILQSWIETFTFEDEEYEVEYQEPETPCADLAASIGFVPAEINFLTGANAIDFTVTNNGPSDAENVVIDIDVSGEATIKSVKPFGAAVRGTTAYDSTSITLKIPSIAANELARLLVNLAGGNPDVNDVEATMSATASTLDWDPENNQAGVISQGGKNKAFTNNPTLAPPVVLRGVH